MDVEGIDVKSKGVKEEFGNRDALYKCLAIGGYLFCLNYVMIIGISNKDNESKYKQNFKTNKQSLPNG